MSLILDKILKKGLQSQLDSKEIDDCALSFTTDTKRLYIEDGTSRVQITDVIFGMTKNEILNNVNLLPKFYVASDTLDIYVSDGTTLELVNEFIPVSIAGTETQNYYPIMRSADGTTNVKGYTTDVSYNPSTKQFAVGDFRVTQSLSGNDTVVDIYIDSSSN